VLTTRRLVALVVAAFVLFEIYKDPNGTGGYVHDVIGMIARLVLSVFRFFGAVAM
jgi:cytochrome b